MDIAQQMAQVRRQTQQFNDNVRGMEFQIDNLRENLAQFGVDLTNLEADEVLHQKVLLTFKEISDTRNQEGKAMLESVLNWALSNIPLEQRYEASLQESVRGTKKELSIVLRDMDTGLVRNLKNQSGTALVQIISFLMNIIVIMLSNSSRVMLLDECFSGLQDQETITMFGEILVALARNEGFQFIMVEHKSELSVVEGITAITAQLNSYEDGVQFIQAS